MQNKTLMMKLIGVILVLILSLGNFLVLVSYAAEISNGSEIDIFSQDAKTNNKNVEFDAYLLGSDNKSYSAMLNVDDINKIHISLKISDKGYLKTGLINFEDESFNIKQQDESVSSIQNIDYDKKEILLNQINSGTELELAIPVEFAESEIFNIQNLNKNNKVWFTGVYVTEKGKEVEIEKEILLNIQWDRAVNGIVEQKISKFINDIGNSTLIELEFNSGLEESRMPLKETNIELEVPEIEGKLPKYVNVVGNEFEYIEEEKKVKANIQNPANENGDIVWKNALDKLKVILAYDKLTDEEKTIALNSKAVFDVYGKEDKVEQTASNEFIINKNTGNANEITVSSESKELYKSFMYAASNYETEYNLNWNLNIGYAETTDKLVISDVNENFINSEEEKTNANTNTYYKQTIINKKSAEDILGQDGYIKILNATDEELANILLNTIQDENIIINYQNKDLNKIKIEISKPQIEGSLEIKHVKAIKEKTEYEKELLKTFVLLENEINLNTKYNETVEAINQETGETVKEIKEIEITNLNALNNINLLEPETKIEVNTNKESLVTESINEDIEIYVSLINNKQEYSLFNNSVIDIKLPKELDYIKLKDARLIFEEELSIANKELYEAEDGTKHIKISLEGTQTKYNIGNIINGGTLNITADMSLSLEQTIEAEIEAVCLNEGTEAIAKTRINLVKVELPEVEDETQEEVPQDEKQEEIPEEDENENIQEEPSEIVEESKLQVNIKSSVDEATWVKWGELVKYTINIKNISDKPVYNVLLKSDIPENTVYTAIPTEGIYGPVDHEDNHEIETIKWNIEKINPGKTIQKEYEVRFIKKRGYEEEQLEVVCNAKALVDNQEIISNDVKNILTKGYVQVYLNSNIVEDALVKEDKFEYTANIRNISGENLQNVKFEFNIPNGIVCEEAYISTYNAETSEFGKNTEVFNITNEKVELIIPNFESGQIEDVIICLKVQNPEQIGNGKLQDKVTVIANDTVHQSNTKECNINLPKLEVTQMSSQPEGDIKNSNILKYIIQTKNIGNCAVENLEITDFLPKGVKHIKTENYSANGQEAFVNYGTGKVEVFDRLKVGEILTTSITVQVLGANNEEIENVVKIKAEGIEEIQVNNIKHTISSDNSSSNNNQEGQGQTGNDGGIKENKTHSISGLAWVDANSNGIKDIGEATLNNVKVMLLNNESQIKNTVVTNENGFYSFEGLENGNYIVVFLYDTNTYGITKYKANIDETINSDVIEAKIELNGKEQTAGVTDTLQINGADIHNLNIGLIKNPKFDLKLEKYVSQIKVKDPKGETTYNYDNTKLAKVEFASKYVDKTDIVITYTIKVINQGEIDGLATKIADYIPEGLVFNEKLNPGWYIGEDGNLYSNNLENEKIMPGETKEVKLVLTKKMSGEDTGIINNNAEIFSSNNNYGLQDKDSTYGNNKTSEDDLDYANVYLGIKTGKTILYISLITSQTIILGVGIYLIKRKVLTY